MPANQEPKKYVCLSLKLGAVAWLLIGLLLALHGFREHRSWSWRGSTHWPVWLVWSAYGLSLLCTATSYAWWMGREWGRRLGILLLIPVTLYGIVLLFARAFGIPYRGAVSLFEFLALPAALVLWSLNRSNARSYFTNATPLSLHSRFGLRGLFAVTLLAAVIFALIKMVLLDDYAYQFRHLRMRAVKSAMSGDLEAVAGLIDGVGPDLQDAIWAEITREFANAGEYRSATETVWNIRAGRVQDSVVRDLILTCFPKASPAEYSRLLDAISEHNGDDYTRKMLQRVSVMSGGVIPATGKLPPMGTGLGTQQPKR